MDLTGSPLQDTDDRLQRWIMLSIGAHVAVALFFVVRVAFFDSSEALLYQSAVRVDIVGLPDKIDETPLAPPPKNAEPPSKVETPEKKETPKPVVEKTIEKPSDAIDLKKKQNAALERLKALQALEDEVKEQERKKKSTKTIKGNAVSPGTALRGTTQLEYNDYAGNLDSHIKANWLLPEWLARGGFRARALVKIDEQGHVLEKRLLQPSNNPEYDNAVMEAIDRSSPFPVPPEKFVQLVRIDGIIFQFPN